jgi:hypothetical protein
MMNVREVNDGPISGGRVWKGKRGPARHLDAAAGVGVREPRSVGVAALRGDHTVPATRSLAAAPKPLPNLTAKVRAAQRFAVARRLCRGPILQTVALKSGVVCRKGGCTLRDGNPAVEAPA